jgi:hypothetical protein
MGRQLLGTIFYSICSYNILYEILEAWKGKMKVFGVRIPGLVWDTENSILTAHIFCVYNTIRFVLAGAGQA